MKLRVLLDLLFQVSEQIRIKEVLDGDSQAIAELLDRGNGGAAVASADDIVHSGLGHTADAAEFINRNISLAAEFQDAILDSFSDVHGYHLISNADDSQFLLKRLTLLS